MDPSNIERLRGYSNPREVRYECEDFEPTYYDPCADYADGGGDGGDGADGSGGDDGLGVDVEAEFIVGE